MTARFLLPTLALLAACRGSRPATAPAPVPEPAAAVEPPVQPAPTDSASAASPLSAPSAACAERVAAATSMGTGGKGRPLFEFEVEHRAEYSSGESIPRPRPALPGNRRVRALALFVVDPAGRVDPAGMRLVETRGIDSTTAINALRAAAPRWRYRPATISGCVVAQVVQTPVEF